MQCVLIRLRMEGGVGRDGDRILIGRYEHKRMQLLAFNRILPFIR